MASYKMDKGPKNQFIFDKNLSLLQSQDVSGGLASLFANRKPKPPSSKKSHKHAKHNAAHSDPVDYQQPPTYPHAHARNYHHQYSEYNATADPFDDHVHHERAPEFRQHFDAFGDAGQVAITVPRASVYEQSSSALDADEDEASEGMDISSGSEAEVKDEGAEVQAINGGQPVDYDSDMSVEWQYASQEMSDNMDLSSGPDADDSDESDQASRVPSASIDNARESAPSTRTSQDVHLDAAEAMQKDSKRIESMLKKTSRASSLSSQLSAAVSPTPVVADPPAADAKARKRARRRQPSKETKIEFASLRPRASIPQNISMAATAQQAIQAAYASRLNPFALHMDEYRLLKDHICHLHVTAYLNIRNRILRLWVRNPLVSVTPEEAAGCATSSRWLGLAEVAYEWLVRRGYINFGCVEVPEAVNETRRSSKMKKLKKKRIVVVGAGMSGIACARQLDGLLRHYRDRWTSAGEDPPNIVLLEGRNRIGGRVYSHPLTNQNANGIPNGKRCTAELGAHIIVGFDHGNPMNILVRGQLALHYYALKNDSVIHDTDGNFVNEQRDHLVEKLFNDILDRASVYRHRNPPVMSIEGDRGLIEVGRDPQREGGPTISAAEKNNPNPFPNLVNEEVENVPGGIDKLTGKAHMIYGTRKKETPAMAAESMGWKLAPNVLSYQDLNLDVVAKASKNPTLGAAMDEAVKQYQFLLDLSPSDMRLLNWHYANLEYANAANVGKLSLGGWDQDAGNEFEGTHAQVIGGYQQVPRGVLLHPTKLDLHTGKVVRKITYNMYSGSAYSGTSGAVAKVDCEDGRSFEADHVVLTSPLGVLKARSIEFDPPLPEWKTGPIDRLGFGTLNKLVLVYEEAFWPEDQDMFGLLREPVSADSLNQEDYIANRGRFYFFWNCIRTSGRPVLISLMAGDAAHQAEARSDSDLVAEVTQELTKIFSKTKVPLPSETIVTRWGQDRFARGSYSFVGPNAISGDYEAMAAPYGNLHFAGEATCATHPATVHGAYISGLRAASEVIDDLLGPIDIPHPLVPWPSHAEHQHHHVAEKSPQSKKTPAKRDVPSNLTAPNAEEEEARLARLEGFENDILQAIYGEIGLRPSAPEAPRANPFLLYTSQQWASAKQQLEGNGTVKIESPGSVGLGVQVEQAAEQVKITSKAIRTWLAEKWNALSKDDKQPYVDEAKTVNMERMFEHSRFPEVLRDWDSKAVSIRQHYIEQHPGVLSKAEEADMWKALDVYGDFSTGAAGERKAKKMSGYADRPA